MLEMQFALAYSSLTLPKSSEYLVPAELEWWLNRLHQQIALEKEKSNPEEGKRGAMTLTDIAAKMRGEVG